MCTLLSDMHIWIATKKKRKDEEERDTAKPQKENEEIQWRARWKRYSVSNESPVVRLAHQMLCVDQPKLIVLSNVLSSCFFTGCNGRTRTSVAVRDVLLLLLLLLLMALRCAQFFVIV